MSATSLLCARVNFYKACRRNVKNAGQTVALCFMRPAYMRPVVAPMGNTRFSRVGFWAKCHPEREERCQNARFRFMPCTGYGAAVRKKQGSCIHLPDGFGTGFPPDNSKKPFLNSVYTVYLFILSHYLEAFFPIFLVGSYEKCRTNPIVRPYFGRVFISSTGPTGCLWHAGLRLCLAR